MTKAAVKENELDIMVNMINADPQHIARSKAKANMYRYMAERGMAVQCGYIAKKAKKPATRKRRVFKDSWAIACVSLVTTLVLVCGICIGSYF